MGGKEEQEEKGSSGDGTTEEKEAFEYKEVLSNLCVCLQWENNVSLQRHRRDKIYEREAQKTLRRQEKSEG